MTIRICALLFLATGISCSSSKKQHYFPEDQVSIINKEFNDAAAQYKVMMKNLSADQFPRSYDPKTDKFITSKSDWWCSGFIRAPIIPVRTNQRSGALFGGYANIESAGKREK